MNTSAIERLPHVEAALRYLEPMSDKPRSLEYEPPPGVPRTTAVYRDHIVAIRDVRPVASALSLEREGFQLVTAASSLTNFYDRRSGSDPLLRRNRVNAPGIDRCIPRSCFRPYDSSPHSGRGGQNCGDSASARSPRPINDYTPSHRWFYASAMRRDEVMLIKCFDSANDGRARFVPHSAFVDPTTPAGALPRESIELRTLVFYEA